MSRTDKDAPGWVRAAFYEPRHFRCQHTAFRRRTCDLPAAPIRRHDSGEVGRSCHWRAAWDFHFGPAPHWFVRLEFTGPDRRAVRDACTKARAEYRATGEVDAIPPTTQHRHRARRVYW